MRLPEALREACVAARATARDKDDALAAVARLAKNCPLLEGVDEAEILGTLTQRESLGSTGFGGGIAIPHCRLANVPDFVVGLMALSRRRRLRRTRRKAGSPDRLHNRPRTGIVGPHSSPVGDFKGPQDAGRCAGDGGGAVG